jgi:hypothetical protein
MQSLPDIFPFLTYENMRFSDVRQGLMKLVTDCWLQTPPIRSNATARMKTVHDFPAPTSRVCGEVDIHR